MLNEETEINSINIPEDLSKASNEQIEAIISYFGLRASIPFIREVGKCLFTEKIAPDEEILRFFDMIYVSATSRSENTEISEIFADDEEIVRTFSDLYTKYNYVTDKNNDSISLDEMAKVASKYLLTLGIRTPSSVSPSDADGDLSFFDERGNTLASISLDDKKPLPYGYESATEKSQSDKDRSQAAENDEFWLIFLDSYSSHKEYRQRFEMLSKDSAFIEQTKLSQRIDNRGILFAILSMSCGASVYLSSIYGTDSGEHLTDLISLHHGEHIVAVSEESASDIEALAATHGLRAQRIAVASALPSIKIITNSRELDITIRANFLRRLFSQKIRLISTIPSEVFSPTSYENIFCKKDGLQSADVPGDTVILHKGHTVSARYTHECSFVSGINAVLDSVFSLLAAGVDRRKIGITLKVGITSTKTFSSVAAVLGAYRVMTELCLPQADSQVVNADEDFIFCCAYAKEEIGAVRPADSFEAADENNVYLLSFGRFDNTTPKLMPDFSEVRKMCDALHSMISKKEIASARAVNGSVMDAAKRMCPDGVQLIPLSYDGISNGTSAQGFVIELRKGSRINAPIIGALKKDQLCN